MTFPNLFFIADRIGDFQLRIMKDFPESKLLLQQQFMIGVAEDADKIKAIADQQKQEAVKRIWQFNSGTGVTLNVAADSLGLVSTQHKSYSIGAGHRFRDAIANATAVFLEVTQVPLLLRVGLRYIDNAPVPSKRSTAYERFYKTAFPLDRFPLESAESMSFQTIVQRESCRLRYVESLSMEGEQPKLKLDFDAWSERVEAAKLLDLTDKLHDTISTEFFGMIKKPVLDYMSRRKEVVDVACGA